MDKESLLKSELVGLKVEVCGKKIQGKVIDETRNMLVIECDGSVKKAIKNSNDFEFEFNGQKIKINGKTLVGRPEERIKRVW